MTKYIQQYIPDGGNGDRDTGDKVKIDPVELGKKAHDFIVEQRKKGAYFSAVEAVNHVKDEIRFETLLEKARSRIAELKGTGAHFSAAEIIDHIENEIGPEKLGKMARDLIIEQNKNRIYLSAVEAVNHIKRRFLKLYTENSGSGNRDTGDSMKIDAVELGEMARDYIIEQEKNGAHFSAVEAVNHVKSRFQSI